MGIQKFSLDDFSCDIKSMKRGGEACVFKGEHSKHGEVAIKQWHHVSDFNIKEVELLMENAYHQNIIQLLGILVDGNSRCIGYFMPYMPNGSLGDVIHNKSQHYDGQQIKSWILQICYGLSYLHDQKIIHRDMKPSNVLLGKSRDDVKLSDFGISRSLEDITTTLTRGLGTLFYMAPEMLQEEKYDFSVDVYSLSITIWEILHRKHPYDRTAKRIDLIIKIAQGKRPQLESNLSKEESDLLMRCWDADASKRPTIDNVLGFCRKTTFSLIDLESSLNEFVPSFEHFNASNNNESTAQISFDKTNDDLPIPNPIEQSPGKWDKSLMMLENNGQNWKELNIRLPYATCHHGAQFLNDNIYIFGGTKTYKDSLNWTYKLSKSLQWEKIADMNEKHCYISNSSVILNNQIWVCGGFNEGERSLKSVEMYDPLTNKWKYMKQMNECRYHSAAAVVNGKIFCSGGFGDEHAPLKSVECYDPSSDVWTLICNMPQEICAHGAIEMNGNFIVMGGYNLQNKYLKNVWALDITDKDAAWIEKQSMPMPCKEFSIARIDNEIFICGGAGTDYTVEIFEGEVWKNGPKMPARRYYTPAVVISMEFARSLN